MHSLRSRLLWPLLLIVLASGCGSGPRPMRVWGEASYDGKPIEQGEIIFFPIEETRGPSTGGPIENGRYDIPAQVGPQAGGTYRVEITALQKGKRYVPAVSGEGPAVEPMVNFLPDVYNRKSTLRATISDNPNDNQRDFKLERAKK